MRQAGENYPSWSARSRCLFAARRFLVRLARNGIVPRGGVDCLPECRKISLRAIRSACLVQISTAGELWLAGGALIELTLKVERSDSSECPEITDEVGLIVVASVECEIRPVYVFVFTG